MNEVTIFESEQFGAIRTSGDAENPMFCLNDVCSVLELRAQDVKKRLNEKGVDSINTPTRGGVQHMLYINEQNLYKVIMRSDKPQAEPFQDWVCGEVLPAIRKNGGYLRSRGMSDEEIMAQAFLVAKRTIEQKNIEIQTKDREIVRLENDNVLLTAENQELRDDHNYLELIMRSRKMMTVSQIAQDYGMSGKAMNNQLASMGIQYKVNGQWILYSKYKDCGYVSSRSIEITRSDGRPDIVLHTEWTQAGRKFLYEELKKLGIIPMLER